MPLLVDWKRTGAFLLALAALAGVGALFNELAFDSEVEAGFRSQKKQIDLEYYDRRVAFAELRTELYCTVKPSPQECSYWTKQLRQAKRDREHFMREP
jgi:hypothetical protein